MIRTPTLPEKYSWRFMYVTANCKGTGDHSEVPQETVEGLIIALRSFVFYSVSVLNKIQALLIHVLPVVLTI